jgi:hypothetical protein
MPADRASLTSSVAAQPAGVPPASIQTGVLALNRRDFPQASERRSRRSRKNLRILNPNEEENLGRRPVERCLSTMVHSTLRPCRPHAQNCRAFSSEPLLAVPRQPAARFQTRQPSGVVRPLASLRHLFRAPGRVPRIVHMPVAGFVRGLVRFAPPSTLLPAPGALQAPLA